MKTKKNSEIHKELKKIKFNPIKVKTKEKPKTEDKKEQKEEQKEIEKPSEFHETILEESISREAPVIKNPEIQDDKVENLEEFASDLPSTTRQTTPATPYASTNISYGLNTSSSSNYDGTSSYQSNTSSNLADSPFEDRRNTIVNPFAIGTNAIRNEQDTFRRHEEERLREQREGALPFEQRRKKHNIW